MHKLGRTADDLIAALDLSPHPEGGWYKQTWAGPIENGRPIGTCIFFLLKAGETSHWHRVDATEIWLFHDGDPLEIRTSETDEGPAESVRLGSTLDTRNATQVIVEKDFWQSTRPIPSERNCGWSLVSCTVTPGFTFDGFELADGDFDIPAAEQHTFDP